ncbi:MAG TPA: hypothetical protein VJ826_09990 [Candidatus Polarisedimenticolaceae bacterium]|nr:hypothetical protein [Candidatus Polarisedimenticolaceae bacterium]
MPQDTPVYDLGEVDMKDRKPVAFPAIFGSDFASATRSERVRHEARSSGRVRPQLAGSLSLFVPGLGHVVAGEATWGLFYAASLGFCAAAVWAMFSMRSGLIATMKVLEIRPEILVVAVAATVVMAMLLHLAGISHAQTAVGGPEESGAHPIVAALASLLVPGWGQILAGRPKRATLFVGTLWLIAAAWCAATPLGMRALHALGIEIPPAIRDDWGTAILIAAPAILWFVAVYDAARK